MNKLLFIICAALAFAACGGSGSRSTIEIKYDGKEIPFVENEKSGWHTVQRALYGASGDFADRRHALRWITLRNYEFDAAKISPNSDKLTAPEQVKIFLSLHDEPGTDVDTPLKATSFKGAKSGGGPMNFELINVYVFRDGKEEIIQLYPSQAKDPATCEVKIISVDGNMIKGEINAVGQKDGKEFSVKGPFTAQIHKR
jgi:hypothetical protein